MDMSELITMAKMDLGIYTIALPFTNPEEVLEKVVKMKTLKIFSIYLADYENFRINLTNLQTLTKSANAVTYLLPDVFNDRKILNIRRVEYDDINVNGLTYWGGAPMGGGLIQAGILANANAKLIEKMIPKLTFKYKHPRELTLYNAVNSTNVNIEIGFQHHDSLQTIKPMSEDSFYQLALLDIKIFLYNTMKHYNDLPSAFGNVTLKIDEWQGADAERDSLLKEWSELAHIDVTAYEWG